MISHLFRFVLFTKVFLRSIIGIVLLTSMPIMSIVLYKEFGIYEIEGFLSMMYEHVALIWLMMIVYGICTIEFDAAILKQSVTYPLQRWKIALEKLLFSYSLFFIILVVVTIPFTMIMGTIVIKAVMYAIPIYIFLSALMFISIIFVRRALSGLLLALFVYILATVIAPLLGANFQIVMLRYGSVINFIRGEFGYAWAENSFYYMNRLLYLTIGLICIIIAIIKFQRKPV